MFTVTILEDLVRINPSNFTIPNAVAIEDELNKKYSNKIIHNVGLCVRLFDISSISDPIVHSCQDGSFQCKGILNN